MHSPAATRPTNTARMAHFSVEPPTILFTAPIFSLFYKKKKYACSLTLLLWGGFFFFSVFILCSTHTTTTKCCSVGVGVFLRATSRLSRRSTRVYDAARVRVPTLGRQRVSRFERTKTGKGAEWGMIIKKMGGK